MRSTKRKRTGWFNKIVFLLNSVAIVLLLVSYLASVINPDDFWVIAFIGLGYPFILVVNVLFAIYWLFKRPVFALGSVVVILLGWKFLVSTIGFRESSAVHVPKSSDNLIRVMSWNVHFFKKFEQTYDLASRDQMLDVIRREQPDILCIQEFFSRRKGDFNFRKSIIEILKSEHYHIESLNGNDYEMAGIAIFSKFPVKKSGLIPFPDVAPGNEGIFADFEVNGKKFRIYNVHLQSIRFQPEDYKLLKEIKEAQTNVKETTRLGGMLKTAFIKRGEQVDFLKSEMEKLDYPVIVAGDFNDTPISYAVNTVGKGMKNTFRERGSGFAITYNGDFPNFQIDYILVSPQFEVKNYIIIDKKLSDHFPIRADLELK